MNPFEDNYRDENDDSAYGPIPIAALLFVVTLLLVFGTILAVKSFS